MPDSATRSKAGEVTLPVSGGAQEASVLRVQEAWRELFGSGDYDKDEGARVRKRPQPPPFRLVRGPHETWRALSPTERRLVATVGHVVAMAVKRGHDGVTLTIDDICRMTNATRGTAGNTKKHIADVASRESTPMTATNGVTAHISVVQEGTITFWVTGVATSTGPIAYTTLFPPGDSVRDAGTTYGSDSTKRQVMRRLEKWVDSLSPAARKALNAFLFALGLGACYGGYKAYEYLVMQRVVNERPGDALPERLAPSGTIASDQETMVVTMEPGGLAYVATIKQPERFTRGILAADPNANIEWFWEVFDGDRNASVYKVTKNARLRVVGGRVGQTIGFESVFPRKVESHIMIVTPGEPQEPGKVVVPTPEQMDELDTLVLSDASTHAPLEAVTPQGTP